MIDVYITCKDRKEAIKISNYLLRKRLIACVNYWPIESLYWWKGRLVKDKEFALLVKTTERNYKKVEKNVKKLHSYTLPAIIKIKTDASPAYSSWVKKETKS